jgi:hypothetical protein
MMWKAFARAATGAKIRALAVVNGLQIEASFGDGCYDRAA